MDKLEGIYFKDENDLRARILDLSPDIRRDVNHLADILLQMVQLEISKRGLDNPLGSITLVPNPRKTSSKAPDFVGSGRIAGRSFRAAAWKSGQTLRIGLELSGRNRGNAQ